MGKQNEKMKMDSKRKSLGDVSPFSERGPNVQFQYSTKASSAPHHKLASKKKKVEMKENEAHLILGQMPLKRLAGTMLLLPSILT